MKPFLHDEVFCPSDKYEVRQETLDNGMPLLIVDNYFKNFEALQEIVNNTPAGNWKMWGESRNFKDYYDCRISFTAKQEKLFLDTSKLIHANFNTITSHNNPTIDVNWFKQINNKRADFAFPHHDQVDNRQQFTCLVYLNDTMTSSGGTAFFKLKEGEVAGVETGQDYWPEGEQNKWEMVDYIEMVPNRLIIFPAHYYHAAYHPANYFDAARLTLVYWMTKIV